MEGSKGRAVMALGDLAVPELLQLYTQVLGELRNQGVLRTKNVLGDYTEWLVAEKLGLTLSGNSTAGYDAVDNEGYRYQIKGRQPTPENPSTQLGALRSLDRQDFDFLIGVLFNADFTPRLVIKAPHAVVVEHARYMERVNAHRLHLQGGWLRDPRVQDITELFAGA
jgi:hypothetical protein